MHIRVETRTMGNSLLLSLFLIAGAAAAAPVDRATTRCTLIPVPLGGPNTDWKLERCAADIEQNAIWQLDRSDSIDGDLNGQAVRRTTGRGTLVYVLDSGVLARHDEFQRTDAQSSVIGGFDAYEASGQPPSGCPNFATDPCYQNPSQRRSHGHGTSVASVVAGRNVGIAPDAKLYAERIYPTQPGTGELSMWHVALDDIIRHAWDPATPPFQTAIVTCSVPATPRPSDPLYLTLVEKVKRMTQGVDAAGNADPNGKKFLFTIAAGNIVGSISLCETFPAILGPELDGLVAVGGITRDNVWWSGSCKGELVEVVAPAEGLLMASISAADNYLQGPELSGTSFAAPYVAGIAARLLEIDPSRTPAELEALLKRSPSHAADSGLPVPVLPIGREMRKSR